MYCLVAESFFYLFFILLSQEVIMWKRVYFHTSCCAEQELLFWRVTGSCVFLHGVLLPATPEKKNPTLSWLAAETVSVMEAKFRKSC